MVNNKKQTFSQFSILIIIIGVVLSALLFLAIDRQEKQRLFAEFQRDVDERTVSFRSEIELAFGSLYGIRGLFLASTNVDRQEFKTFVTPFLSNLPGVQALEWIPKVTNAQRLKFETDTQKEGFNSFQITQRQSQGSMVRAKKRQEYFPVHYLEPFQKNRAAFGFDLASSATRLETLEKSRDLGLLHATERITLVQEKGTQQGFLAFLPIYKGSTDSVEKRRQQLFGFALGVFRLGDIFEAAMEKVSRKELGIDIKLFDKSVTKDKQFLNHHKLQGDYELDNNFIFQKTITNIGGRDWLLVATPATSYISARRTLTPYLGLGAGLVITIILSLFLQSNTNKRLEVENLINIRTSELRDREEENRVIVEAAANALIMINHLGIIENFNPAAENMFGYTHDEVIGKNVKILMPDPNRSAHDGHLANYINTGVAKIIGKGREVEGQRKDGTIFPLYLAVGEREIKQQKKFVGFLLDITKQKEADRLKSEFISTVSHELRTPLTSIKGSLGLVAGGVMGEIPEKALKLLDKAVKNTDRLTFLINDLLDIDKMQTGDMELEIKPINCCKLLDKAISANQGYSDKFAISLQLVAEAQKGLSINGDENRLIQVLSNLISNAVKFSPENGNVELSISLNGDFVRISVKDHGPGISEEFKKRIFHKFAQGDSSDTRRQGGTGLGLAISKSIIEKQGGIIGYDTKLGEGSTFYIDLPKA
ncbi:MAG: CHASE domain-containing protein [Magnetococcales bacterium]|nr:CHASE domain-containing protein [Magnetococcales bacterium]